jgi:hypothetical protein
MSAMTEIALTLCPDCGHTVAMHHPSLTRGDGCIGRPDSADMASLGEIREGRQCRCSLQPSDLEDGWADP